MSEGNGGAQFRPRSGRDLFMVPQADRLNDQFRLVDTMVLSMTDSWAYLPPRAKHILWLKLASCDRGFLESCGMPLENGVLLHWSMWPDDLGDYAQAVSLRSSRQQLEYLEPKNIAMASAIKQAEMAESTARLQIQLAQILLQLSSGGADATELAKLFSKNKFDRESIQTVLKNAEEAMAENLNRNHRENQGQRNAPPHTPPPQHEPEPQQGPATAGECSECGKNDEYVVGEDEEGRYVIDVCQECYAKIQTDNPPLYQEGDIDQLLNSMNEEVMGEDEIIALSEVNERLTTDEEWAIESPLTQHIEVSKLQSEGEE